MIQTVSILSFALIPIAIGVAITRHGLYEIDGIINRALVVGMLGVFITGVYVAIVVGIGTAIGNRNPSIALSIVATAVVAVAFQPVRERVRALANRLVYGTRATPYEVLSDFASRMAGTYTTTELLPELARVVGEGVGAKRVEVWMTSGSQLEREACWPAGEPPTAPVPVGDGDLPALPGDRVVPVRHQDDLLGVITVTKATAEPVTPTDDKMLAAVASQAGLVLRNLRLIDDLRSSRERLVTTQDDERRRLERNLHDGAQQSLVSVALLTRMAAARASDDHLRASLTEAATQLQQAIEELRELARGIHPAILTERGLGPALNSLAERSPVPVQVEYNLRCRPPETVERTLYFVVAEALTNVAKYAGASSATVTVSQTGHEVTVVVADDGVGGADAARGSGLRGLADRAAAVDGSFASTARPGRNADHLPGPRPAGCDPTGSARGDLMTLRGGGLSDQALRRLAWATVAFFAVVLLGSAVADLHRRCERVQLGGVRLFGAFAVHRNDRAVPGGGPARSCAASRATGSAGCCWPSAWRGASPACWTRTCGGPCSCIRDRCPPDSRYRRYQPATGSRRSP